MIFKILAFDIKDFRNHLTKWAQNLGVFILAITILYFGFNDFIAPSAIVIITLAMLYINSIDFIKDDFHNGIIDQYLIANIKLYRIIIVKSLFLLLINLPMILISILVYLPFLT
ncbi:MAG: hypothetical protein HOM96_01595 [Rickettsiales bacterium]|jgi:ABC-type transport system involved in cytochrome c biogenesis permease component|nr:hypothetical protein [Rickettsiales bacterium]